MKCYIMKGTRVGMRGYFAIISNSELLRETPGELAEALKEGGVQSSQMIFLNEKDIMPMGTDETFIIEGLERDNSRRE